MLLVDTDLEEGFALDEKTFVGMMMVDTGLKGQVCFGSEDFCFG